MFSVNDIRRFDRSCMLGILLGFPDQCGIALEIGRRFQAPKNIKKPKNILWCGVGGSAIGGDVVGSFVKYRIKIPFAVNRHYAVPSHVDAGTLAVFSSYSGNTEEVLSCYGQAKSKRASALVITSGGKMLDLAIRNKDMLLAVPRNMPPRCGLGYLSIPALIAFSKMGLFDLKIKEIDESIRVMRGLKDSLKPAAGTRRNLAIKTAAALYGKTPVIYASREHFGPVAYRWKTQIAENAKTFSSCHLFPEACHNEIEAFGPSSKAPRDMAVVIIKDRYDHARVKQLIKYATAVLRRRAKVLEIAAPGKGVLARIYASIYLGDWVSFYLAIMNGVDPTPIERIQYLKRRLTGR